MTEVVGGFEQYVHYNRDLEMAILGACLIEKNAYGRIQGILQPEHFYDETNQQIFATIRDMWRENMKIDLLTVVPILWKTGLKNIPGNEISYYVTRLTNAVVSSAHIEGHALMIRECHCERELLKISRSSAIQDGDVIARIDKLNKLLVTLRTLSVSDDWSDMTDVMMRVSTHMSEVEGRELIGLTTGFSQVDLMTGGFCKTNLIVIAARPSVGKSALLGKMAMAQAKDGYNVGIISLEMPKVQIGSRLLSMEAEMPFYKIFRNKMDDKKERDQYMDAMGRMTKLPIFISDTASVNVEDIKAKAAQLIYKKQLNILYIDFLQLVDGITADTQRKFNREQEVSKISRSLKIMAMDFEIPVVPLAQLNRESEKTSDKLPQLHHLRESGAIEQDADGVMFLHRDWKSGITTNLKGNSTEREGDIIIAKWRNGELGRFKIGWEPSKMEFFDPYQLRVAERPKLPPAPLEHWRKPYIDLD